MIGPSIPSIPKQETLPPISLPGLQSLPPMSFDAKSGAQGGELFGGSSVFGGGDWTVNTGAGSAGVSTKTIMIIAAGAGVLWFLTHRKKA